MKPYKQLSFLLSFGIMLIGLVSFKFSPIAASDNAALGNSGIVTDTPDKNAETSVTPVTASPSPSPSPTPVPNNLMALNEGDELYDSIHGLIVAFLDAKLSSDRSSFTNIVSDINLINEENLQNRTATILSYNDVKCYIKRGESIIDYIVYYTYYTDIATIDSLAIGIDSVFLTHTENGELRIFTGFLDETVQHHLNAHNEDDDVLELVDATYRELAAEAAADESLMNYLQRSYDSDDDAELLSGSDEASEDEAVPDSEVQPAE